MKNRKGARRRAEIPADVLTALNTGQIATVNLVESLALDQGILLQTAAAEVGLTAAVDTNGRAEIEALADGIWELTFTRRMTAIAELLHRLLAECADRDSLLERFATHPSDMVRSWVPFVDAGDETLRLEERLERVRPFAADSHFGVREWSWMAVRPFVASELERAISLLEPWVVDEDANIRRFATEMTRPCGVWCKHIIALKAQPERAQSLLEPVRSDDSKYVRDSVGNWLNDAGKTQPAWVRNLCTRWEIESPTKETVYVIKRALRNL